MQAIRKLKLVAPPAQEIEIHYGASPPRRKHLRTRRSDYRIHNLKVGGWIAVILNQDQRRRFSYEVERTKRELKHRFECYIDQEDRCVCKRTA